jgi:uncharacterized protein
MSRVGSQDGKQAIPVINAREFARAGETLEGSVPVARLERLVTALSGPEGEVRYRLKGDHDMHGRDTLELAFEASVGLTCQRCLQSFQLPLTGHNRLRLVDSEPAWSADEIEIAADDDDEIVASKAFDVRALLEDEMLLALPLAPRHAQCEVAGGKIELKRDSPFGGLTQLKAQLQARDKLKK